MKIAIDALPLMMSKTGIGYYTYHLLTEFLKIAPENDYYLCDMLWGQSFYHLMQIKNLSKMIDTLQNISNVPFPFKTITRFGFSLYGNMIRVAGNIDEMDLFFGPNYRGIFRTGLKSVITIHDMSHEYCPENLEEKVLYYLKKELPHTAEMATLIIADSQNTKRDILKFLNTPDEKVKVVYVGIDETFRLIKDSIILQSVRKKYNLPEKFILYVGAIQPRKNITGLIQAYCILSKKPDFENGLVIAGGVSWKSDEIHRLVNELGLRDKIRFPGYIAQSDLPILYNLAEAFVFPSLYEGFGLPVLEAMACGIPVVTSNISSLPRSLVMQRS